MKRTYIFSPLALAAGAFLWMSVSSGVAKIQQKDRTGSPVSDPECTMCHAAGANFSTVATFSLADANGTVTEYEPGETYTLTVGIQSTGDSGHGFQAVALLSNKASAGTASVITSGSQVTSLNSRQYFEHSGIATGGTYEMSWVAPVQGSGDVTFYGSALSVNGDNVTTGDEFVDIPDLVITEDVIDGIANQTQIEPALKMYPNPAINEVNIELGSSIISSVQVYSVTGSLVFETKANESSILLDISSFEKGSYFIKVYSNDKAFTSRFVKQ